MIYQYVVTLKNVWGRTIDAISLLLSLLSATVFVAQEIKTYSHFFPFGASALLIVIGLIWNLWRRRKARKPVSYSRILLVAGVTWLAVPSLAWLGLPLVVLALLERPAKLPLEIGFSNDEIVFNTLFKRRFQWKELSNVVLKDGMLTVDFKNNRLFQKRTIDDNDDADEDEFNAYCRRQLEAK